jgi:uncharacterized protein YciI
MPFIIETFDKPNHAHVRQRVRETHLAYLEANKARLLACGAKLDDDGNHASGGLYIVDVETREAAERFIASDPFFLAELFERVTVTRWRKAYLDGTGYL